MPFIDTHTHLHSQKFDADRDAVLQRARDVDVLRMVEIGYDLESSQAAVALAEAHPQIFAVVGIQPNYADAYVPTWLETIQTLAAHPKVVAIGEIGLDYYWNKAPHDVQEELFRSQLALARQLGKPVVIHSRDAHADTVRVLQDAARGQPGVMHSFSGDWAFAEACLDVGFMLSFSGPLTFPKAHELHEVARRAPLDRLLTETDCPYLAPQKIRGKRNEPAYVRFVNEQLAHLRGLPIETVTDALWQNAEQFFFKG